MNSGPRRKSFMERASVVIDPGDPSCRMLKVYIAKVFAELDARPRKLLLTLDVRNDRKAVFTVDYEKGEPVFAVDGVDSVRASFRGRYLAEHDVPLKLPVSKVSKFVLTPTSGNRIKVRKANLIERIFG